MTYFTDEQVAQLLRGINPKRVGTDGKGFSHVEAYEIRAHLTRLFGFGRWSAEVLDQRLVFEDGTEKQGKHGAYMAWTVCYRSLLRLTVCAPDGTPLATYTEGATGEATNQPSRGDAHDLALKTSESQALKRCAFNLGDQFGLSLFGKGSTAALIRRTLVTPDTTPAGEAVDSHITEQLPREDETPEPTADPRQTNAPAAQPVAAVPSDVARKEQEAQRIRTAALAAPPDGFTGSPSRWITHLMGEALKAKVGNVEVESLSGGRGSLRSLLEQRLSVVSEQQKTAAR